ncbi:MAG: hypothetical protein K8S24_00910 [Candidatus Aegiribacteria sp.]|nr:hypothetical protein [Candidatus Aegiribacteria sp.]
MHSVILIILLSVLPENLQPWYASCSEGDWGAAAEKAGAVYAADSTDTEALAAMIIATVLEYDLDADAGIAAESFLPDSRSSLTLTALGLLLMSGTDSFLEDAEDQLMGAVLLDENNVLAFYLLGTLKVEYDSMESALQCFNEALSLDPGFQPAQLEAARLYRDNEDYEKALDGFRIIMTSDSYPGLLALADCILLMDRMGEPGELDSLENALMRADSSAWIYLAQEQLGRRPDISLTAAEKAVQISGFGSFSADLARIFLELNEYGTAIHISLNLLENAAADSTEVLEILGVAYHGNHEINRAERIFLTLLDNDPLSLSALLYLGDIAEQEARTEDAVDYYLRILEQDVFNSEARRRLRMIGGDSYYVESTTGTVMGFSAYTAADISIERGNRALLEWGGSASLSYRFDRRGTSADATFGGRSVTWEEIYGLRRDTLNTNRGWARLGFDYWFHDSYYLEASSYWDRQMYTERPWQISSYCAAGWQKWILTWLWFSPKLGFGSVNARWTSGEGEMYTNDLSVFASAGLKYSKPHTFIREAEISGDVYFPPDNPENFISRGSVSLVFRTWSPLYVSIGYNVDYTRAPEISTWEKFNTSFTTSINFNLF